MTAVALYFDKNEIVHKDDLAQLVDFKSDPKYLSIRDYMADSVLYNSTSYIEEKKPEDYEKDQEDERDQKYAARGNCTEQGLIRFYLKQSGP